MDQWIPCLHEYSVNTFVVDVRVPTVWTSENGWNQCPGCGSTMMWVDDPWNPSYQKQVCLGRSNSGCPE